MTVTDFLEYHFHEKYLPGISVNLSTFMSIFKLSQLFHKHCIIKPVISRILTRGNITNQSFSESLLLLSNAETVLKKHLKRKPYGFSLQLKTFACPLFSLPIRHNGIFCQIHIPEEPAEIPAKFNIRPDLIFKIFL